MVKLPLAFPPVVPPTGSITTFPLGSTMNRPASGGLTASGGLRESRPFGAGRGGRGLVSAASPAKRTAPLAASFSASAATLSPVPPPGITAPTASVVPTSGTPLTPPRLRHQSSSELAGSCQLAAASPLRVRRIDDAIPCITRRLFSLVRIFQRFCALLACSARSLAWSAAVVARPDGSEGGAAPFAASAFPWSVDEPGIAPW